MAVFEVVSGQGASDGRSAVVSRLSRRSLWQGRWVCSKPLRGGNVTFPVARYFQPLRPLDEPADEHRYLAIDNSEEMFKKFREDFSEPANWISRGHLVVVTGDRGYGKTSLIQRCAHWLKQHPQRDCEIVVLDLSDSNWGSEAWDARIQRTFNRIVNKLSSYLTEGQISELKAYSHDIDDSYYYLGPALRSGRSRTTQNAPPIVLIVLLPGYPTAAEVTRYYDLACPGTFFFAEVYEPDQIKMISNEMPNFNRPKTDIQHLVTSVLKSGDAELLADWIRRERPGRPELPSAVVRDRFDSLITHPRISVSELTRLAWGVLRFAAEDAADLVTDAHFAKYYETIIYGDRA
jgi:energy-coupling factor transporter ATP-binding protein EcfA2